MNWILLGTLIVVSALVSWAGDVIGMKLGKKRLTFLHIRPKYTSRIISMLTGIGIAVATLLVLSTASEQVRTALFSMQFVQKQVTDLTAELQKNRNSLGQMEIDLFESRGDLSQKQDELTQVEDKLAAGTRKLKLAQDELTEMRETRRKTLEEQAVLQQENDKLLSESKKLASSVKQLKSQSDALKSGIQRLREGRIAAFTGELLAQGVVSDSAITEQQVDQNVQRLRSEARALLAYRFGKKPDAVKAPSITKESIDAVSSRLTRSPGRWVLRLTALGNAVEGESVQSQLEAFRSKLVYKADTSLYSHTFDADTQRQEIEETVFQALKSLNQRAVRDGVVRDPLTGNVGSIDTGEFIAALDKIAQNKKSIKLEILTAQDIYTEGPLRVKFILK